MDWPALFAHYGYWLLFAILLIEGQPFIILTGVVLERFKVRQLLTKNYNHRE